MKIAVTTSGENLAAPLDRRFGRAARFLVYDTDSKKFAIIDNTQNLNAAQGAVSRRLKCGCSGANAVITGHCGPKAFRCCRRPVLPFTIVRRQQFRRLWVCWKRGTSNRPARRMLRALVRKEN